MEEFVFVGVPHTAEGTFEISTMVNNMSSSSSTGSSMKIRKTVAALPTHIAYSSFADVGANNKAGWFPLPNVEAVKLSIFWMEIPSAEGDVEPASPLNSDVSLRTTEDASSSAAAAVSPILLKPSFGSRLFRAVGGRTSHSNEATTTSNNNTTSLSTTFSPLIPVTLVRANTQEILATGATILHPDDVAMLVDDDCSLVGARRAKLQLRIHSASKLRAANFDGKSDPFVLIAIRGSIRKTKTVKGDLNPEWKNQTFEFGEVENLDEQDQLSMVVKDWDPLGKYKDLGQLVLTLEQIQDLITKDGKIEMKWFDLCATIYQTEKVQNLGFGELGRIQISISYTGMERKSLGSPSGINGSASPMSRLASSAGSRLAASPSGPSSSLMLSPPPDLKRFTTGEKLSSERPKLFVRLIQARNLFASDFGGASDPYFVLKCKSEEKRTNIRTATLNPLYDAEFSFGEKDYVSVNDELRISCMDSDSVLTTLMDDLLGTLSVPIWSLLAAAKDEESAGQAVDDESRFSAPKWFSLESDTVERKCSGEVQLSMLYVNPTLSQVKKDIYKGKVWLFEMHVTVMSAKNLMSDTRAIKAFCVVKCGRDSWKTRSATSSVNPTWSERFRFRRPADASSDRDGIQKTDVLRIIVYDKNSKNATGTFFRRMGRVTVDVSYVMDRLGYIDPSGKSFASWFDLSSSASDAFSASQADDGAADGAAEEDGEGGDGEGGDDGGGKDGDNDDGEDDMTRSVLSTASRVRQKLTRRLSHSLTSVTRSASSASGSVGVGSKSSSAFAASSKSLISSGTSLDSEKVLKTPQIRLVLRLVPIGETREKVKKKLVVRVNDWKPATRGQTLVAVPVNPCLVYLKCRIGFDAITSPNVPFLGNVTGGNPRFHTEFYFNDEIDWVMHLGVQRRDLELKQARKKKQSLTTTIQDDLNCNNTADDQVVLTIHDACDERVLGESRVKLADILPNPTIKFWRGNVITTGNVPGSMDVSFGAIDVREEMVPLLGHLYVRLLSFKSLFPPQFDATLRFVVKYGSRTLSSKSVTGDPCPDLTKLGTGSRSGEDVFAFPVYNAFHRVLVEVWSSSSSSSSGRSSGKSILASIRGPGLLGGSNSSVSLGDVDIGGDGSEDAKETISKYGTLLGSATLTLFDIIEIESQTVFEELSYTQAPKQNAFKMRVHDKSGKDRGSLWLEARYAENMGGVLAPNPNPPVVEDQPFSFANIRHEINRLVRIVGWLGMFGKHVGGLLDWANPKKTSATIVAITIICSVDWFSSRFLLAFPFCMLIHMINRHRLRQNGEFLSEFEETDESEETFSAEVRIACLEAQKPAGIAATASSLEWNSVYARVGLVSFPGKPHKVLGTTRVDSRVEDGVANFSNSKVGYSVRGSTTARPSIQMWKFAESDPPVPSFDFWVQNFTVQDESLLVVSVYRCRNLIAADMNGFSDPFVRLWVKDPITNKMSGESLKTMIQAKTLNPTWNEKFVLGSKKPVLTTDVLCLNVFDSDVVATSDDELGYLEIDLYDLANTFGPANGDGKWLKIGPPRQSMNALKRLTKRLAGSAGGAAGVVGQQDGGDEYGELLIHVEWMDIPNYHQKQQRVGMVDPLARTEDDEELPIEDDLIPIDSWTMCGASVVVDLYSGKDTFLGRARVPVGSLVATDELRAQPQLDVWLPLDKKFDGSREDAKINQALGDVVAVPVAAASSALLGVNSSNDLGKVHVKFQVTLPDPTSKERRIALMEAKRADRANPIKKMMMIKPQLAKLQASLSAVNNRLERMKNLFNWTHPRRSRWMFNLMLILCALFIFIPSRFFILVIVLFFFTEKFRPMGTMGARFKHLLSQIPTDNDLRKIVSHGAVDAKRVPFDEFALGSAESTLLRSPVLRSNAPVKRSLGSSAGLSKGSTTRMSATTSSPTTTDSLKVVLRNINTSDALFSGSLSFQSVRGGGAGGDASTSKHIFSSLITSALKSEPGFVRRYFIVSSLGLHYWFDREASESKEPSGHLLNVTSVLSEESKLKLVAPLGCLRLDCLFLLKTGDADYLFFASSAEKRNLWVEHLKEHVVME